MRVHVVNEFWGSFYGYVLSKSLNFFKFSLFMKLDYNVISKLHLISKMLNVFTTTTHSQQTNKWEQFWKILTEAKN